jgi:hypothetical protein
MRARADRLVSVIVGLRRQERPGAFKKHVCLTCQDRRPRFRYRGIVKADADHTLCFRCYRDLKNRLRMATSVLASVPHRT